MRKILILILILIFAACDNRQSYTLHQQEDYKFDIIRVKDSIFIKTTNNEGCIVDTFYKGKNGYYATWSKKLYFATVDTFIRDTISIGYPHMYPIYRIKKVRNPEKNAILCKYKGGSFYKTEIISYNQDWYKPLVKDMPPELIMAYYYDCSYNIVSIVRPYAATFCK